MALSEPELLAVAERLVQVPGVVGVALGGSRARGDHTPDSDVDVGLYYRPPLDVPALRRLAREVAGPGDDVTEPGQWGPWVDGGGWLRVSGTAVDWIYRDVDRVRASWRDAQAGQFSFHAQVGHPLGVPDFAYVGELELGIVLADPTGELTELRAEFLAYPPLLTDALVGGLWEAESHRSGRLRHSRSRVDRGARYLAGRAIGRSRCSRPARPRHDGGLHGGSARDAGRLIGRAPTGSPSGGSSGRTGSASGRAAPDSASRTPPSRRDARQVRSARRNRAGRSSCRATA